MSMLKKGSLIVSCMVLENDPIDLYDNHFLSHMCKMIEIGGAGGIKLSDGELIRKVKQLGINIPIIGIDKVYKNKQVLITPDIEGAKKVIDSGADILSMQVVENNPDFTLDKIEAAINKIKSLYNIKIIGAISTLEEGIMAEKFGVDYVATTLAGYTPHSNKINGPDFYLVEELIKKLSIPVIAEGKYDSKEQVKKAVEMGAHSVVVGTAITRPHIITKNYCNALNEIEV
ncbi:N-acetylmannosamine-6-phosphate 2-epimerase [Alkaliphilus hydrothermalis]|uniref:N-acylglucosamine-6-phosphate 2-epimerase n=1 Tax=Alkaliphilus hydrothermalis TaxID=1482730 RepID=A0ABS2NTC8_9FIRM|nr:putative N-acetylmannosamine-6-phosphate 2-epimerase [Alkaliphilus hydrothermalis]MBM7616208.1 N-acylglucosamine-6-phosphate 2-epimerase [Alkaliphilus hydrothermalis]